MATKAKNTTNDDGKLPGTDVAPIDLENEDAILALLESMGEAVVTSPDEVSMAILERILRSESIDQLLAPQGTTHARDIIGQTIVILGVHFLESTVEGDGPPVYAVLDCLVDGEPCAVTCGARTVLIQVLKAKNMDWLPFTCKIEESAQTTKRGYRPMWLSAATPASNRDAAPADEEPF